MNDLVTRQAVSDWLEKWNGYIDEDVIARMRCRIIDIPSADAIELGVEYDGSCFSVTVETKTEVYRNDSDTIYIPRRVFKVERL